MMLVQPFNDLRLQCFGNLSPDLFWYHSKLFPLHIVTPSRKVKNYQALTSKTILSSVMVKVVKSEIWRLNWFLRLPLVSITLKQTLSKEFTTTIHEDSLCHWSRSVPV